MTAITSTSIVAPRSIDAGSMWPFHQTKSTPPIAATNAREAEGERAVEHDVVAERRHAHRVVADALQRQPERRAHDVAQQRVDDERARRARRSRAGSGARRRCRSGCGVGMPLMPPKPETSVTWPKKRFAITENVSVIIRK